MKLFDRFRNKKKTTKKHIEIRYNDPTIEQIEALEPKLAKLEVDVKMHRTHFNEDEIRFIMSHDDNSIESSIAPEREIHEVRVFRKRRNALKQYLFENCKLNGLNIDGSLDLFNVHINTLPENLHVFGDLNLVGSEIEVLPRGLTVDGSLWLAHTKITEIPADIVVGGALGVEHTSVKEVPKTAKISGKVYYN